MVNRLPLVTKTVDRPTWVYRVDWFAGFVRFHAVVSQEAKKGRLFLSIFRVVLFCLSTLMYLASAAVRFTRRKRNKENKEIREIKK